MTAKVIVQFSGGKDSQACLIYACEKYGANKITAVFCDTGWEHELTYQHVQDTCKALGVNLITLYNESAGGMANLCRRMKWFPDTQKRMCTVQLKIWPMIDWILAQDDHLIIIQGIRAKESDERALMDEECMYFKEYFEEVKPGEKRKSLYKKRAVLQWCKTHDASVLRQIQNACPFEIDRGKMNAFCMGATWADKTPCEKRVYTVLINRHNLKDCGLHTYTASFSTEKEQIAQVEAIEEALAKDGYEQKAKRDSNHGGKWQLGDDVFFIACTENDLNQRFNIIPSNTK